MMNRDTYTLLAALFAQGDVTVVNATGPTQKVQVQAMADEVLDDVQHYEPFGFTAQPVAGMQALVLFKGGNRTQPIATVIFSPGERPTDLQPGEVCLYNAHGVRIDLRDDGKVYVQGDVIITGNVLATGTITAQGNVVAQNNVVATQQVQDSLGTLGEMRTVYNSHTHGGGVTPTPLMD